MWRTTGVLAVTNRLRDYWLVRANYGTVLQYCFFFSAAHERKTVRYFGSTTVQFRLLGYSSEQAIISDTTLPEQTPAANGRVLEKQPPLNRQHSLQEQGRLRADYETRTESYEVLLYCLQQYKGYTIYLAYYNVVVEEGWAGHEDGAQKTGIPSAEFLAVKLLVPRRSPTTDRP